MTQQKVDFADAATRHWQDARTLHQKSRWPNADHLYGLSGECALKAVMVALGMQLDARGMPPKPYQQHVNRLVSEFRTFAQRNGGAHYAGMLPNQPMFAAWDISQRYFHSSEVAESQANQHHRDADQLKRILDQARMDGRIR